MPDFSPETPGMSETEAQTARIFNVVAGGVAARNLTRTGFLYRKAVMEPLRAVSGELQTTHGLTSEEVLERVKKASELEMTVREHIESMLPEDPTLLRNKMMLGDN